MYQKIFKVVGNIFIYFVVLGLLGSSFAKLMGEKSVTEALNLINLTNPIYVGFVELTCAFLLGIPKTRRLGLFMCTAFLGGVIVAENALNGKPFGGIMLITILWIGAFLRDKKLFGFPTIFKKE